ncbi:hypothetical protein D3C71_1670200 [compost metagenome]
MENLTFCDKSKLSMAFIRPMQPTWNKSSTNSPLLLNLWITLRTSLRLPFTNFSLADRSPCCCSEVNSCRISTFVRTGSLAVSTPQISTLFRVMMIYLPRRNITVHYLPGWPFYSLLISPYTILLNSLRSRLIIRFSRREM